MLSASRRARCSPSGSISGDEGVAARGGFAELLFQAAHGSAFAAMALFESGEHGAGGGVLFADGGGLRFEFLEFLALAFEGLFAGGAQAFLLVHRGAVVLALGRGALGVAAQAFQFQAGHGEARVGAGKLVAQLAHFVIEGHAVLLAGLLQGAQTLQFGFQPGDFLLDAFQHGAAVGQSLLAGLQLDAEFAGFALHGQRAGPRFLASGDRLAVIADAVGKQEIEVRIGHRETLRGGAVLGEEAQRDARQQVDGAVAEAVGEPQRVAEARGDAGFGADGRLGQLAFAGGVRFGMHQEGGAAVEFRADEVESALGLLPAFHHHIFQLFVEEFFGGFFELRVDLHEVGQDAGEAQVGGLAASPGRRTGA